MIRKNCEYCEEEFTSDYDKKYCSRKCMGLDYRKGETKNCSNCGEDFYVSQKDLKRGRGKYCSRSCSDIGRRTGQNFICSSEGCENEFYVSKSRVDNSETGNFYCSTECRKTGEYLTCVECGEEFYLPDCHIGRGKGKYCSKDCMREHRTEECECRNCGDLFERPKCYDSYDRGYCCSEKCNKEYKASRYSKTRPLRRKISSRKYARKQVRDCTDIYVREYMKDYHGLEHIPKQVVKAKKQHIKIKRLIKDKKS